MKITKQNEPVFSVGTVARMLDVSVQTLRLYERYGLILVKKSAGNQRLYTQSDVERLQCIRKAIVEEKISIEGIRRIHSMIPCWLHINCPMEQRLVCPAYGKHAAGCWTYRHETNACKGRDCTACEIYQCAVDCNSIKTMIRDRLTEIPLTEHRPATEDTLK